MFTHGASRDNNRWVKSALPRPPDHRSLADSHVSAVPFRRTGGPSHSSKQLPTSLVSLISQVPSRIIVRSSALSEDVASVGAGLHAPRCVCHRSPAGCQRVPFPLEE
jgi:hypothetical protein